ncbi:MAG TPA: signal peptidase II [Bacillota bacterium]|nr:signal peptidase II [Bacillota bacterium]
MFFLITAATFIMDQASKAVVQALMFQGESVAVVPPFLYFTLVMNPGAAFGLLAYRTSLFVTITVLLVAGVFWGYRKIPPGKRLLQCGLGLVVGGALGNMTDRLRFGRVVDFLDFRVWPVFNLADTAIVIGAFLLILVFMKDAGRKTKRESGF